MPDGGEESESPGQFRSGHSPAANRCWQVRSNPGSLVERWWNGDLLIRQLLCHQNKVTRLVHAAFFSPLNTWQAHPVSTESAEYRPAVRGTHLIRRFRVQFPGGRTRSRAVFGAGTGWDIPYTLGPPARYWPSPAQFHQRWWSVVTRTTHGCHIQGLRCARHANPPHSGPPDAPTPSGHRRTS